MGQTKYYIDDIEVDYDYIVLGETEGWLTLSRIYVDHLDNPVHVYINLTKPAAPPTVNPNWWVDSDMY